MKDDKDKVIPLFVNGELNDHKRRKQANRIQNEKLPTKRFGAGDIFLTIIGLLLVVYGVYSVINKDNNKQEESVNKESNITSNIEFNNNLDYTKYLELDEIEEKRLYTSSDLSLLNTGLNVEELSNNAKLALSSRLANKHTIDGKTYILESDLDSSIKTLFGNINYTNSSFTYGVNTYTYNQETKRYYLMDDSIEANLSYKKYNYIVKEDTDNGMIIKVYVAYTSLDGSFSTTLSQIKLESVIDSNNIKQEYNKLKYYEYEFIKENDDYHLTKISIK